LHEKGLTSKYVFYFLHNSSTSKLFALRETNRFIKFSWELSDDINNYTPIIATSYSTKKDKNYYLYDNILSNANSPLIELDDLKMELVNYSKKKYSLKTILEKMKQKYNIDNEKIQSFYNLLEEKDLLFYSKAFNQL
jgi:hypothetical protein